MTQWANAYLAYRTPEFDYQYCSGKMEPVYNLITFQVEKQGQDE